jgi:hypothetical protein
MFHVPGSDSFGTSVVLISKIVSDVSLVRLEVYFPRLWHWLVLVLFLLCKEQHNPSDEYSCAFVQTSMF